MSASAPEIVAVVPVKELHLAKQRLAAVLGPAERQALARAMLVDVLAAVRRARRLAGAVVVTADAELGKLARAQGAQLLVEEAAGGLNAAVGQAAAHLACAGRAGMLVLPADLPALTALDIDALVDAHPPGAAVSLVPARDAGTNALILSPPQALAVAYGPLSSHTHRARAEAAGLPVRVHPPGAFPGLAHDVDAPADLAGLGRLALGAQTRDLLGTVGFCRLLEPAE